MRFDAVEFAPLEEGQDLIIMQDGKRLIESQRLAFIFTKRHCEPLFREVPSGVKQKSRQAPLCLATLENTLSKTGSLLFQISERDSLTSHPSHMSRSVSVSCVVVVEGTPRVSA